MTQSEIDTTIERIILSHPFVSDDTKIKSKIKELVTRSNPYRLAEYDSDLDFIKDMIKVYLDKSWVTIYGNLMEKVQIEVSGGIKTKEIGVDIEFPKRKIFVGSKSGPYWSNSDQRKTMDRNSKILKETKNYDVYVVCAYGNTIQKYQHYTQIAGQKGWEFLTNDNQMYHKIMIGFMNNKTAIKELKDKIFGDLENQVIEFWISKFYIDGKFDIKKYLDLVSKVK